MGFEILRGFLMEINISMSKILLRLVSTRIRYRWLDVIKTVKEYYVAKSSK